jgi:hypothetical protein
MKFPVLVTHQFSAKCQQMLAVRGRNAPTKPANEVTPDLQPSKPAIGAEVTPDSGA